MELLAHAASQIAGPQAIINGGARQGALTTASAMDRNQSSSQSSLEDDGDDCDGDLEGHSQRSTTPPTSPSSSTIGNDTNGKTKEEARSQRASTRQRPTSNAAAAMSSSSSSSSPSSSASSSSSSSSRRQKIRPAYFYPLDPSDPSSTQDEAGVPVFEPTMEQFADFYQYCQAIDEWGMRSGIVKVVPPKEWRDGLPSLRKPDVAEQERQFGATEGSYPTLESVRIRSAISQHFGPGTKPGLWRQTNITRTAKVWNAKQWSDVCQEQDTRGPDLARMRELLDLKDRLERGVEGAQEDKSGIRTRSGKARPSGGAAAPSKAPSAAKRKRDSIVSDMKASRQILERSHAQNGQPEAKGQNDSSGGQDRLSTPPMWHQFGGQSAAQLSDVDGTRTPPLGHKLDPEGLSRIFVAKTEVASEKDSESPSKPVAPKIKFADTTTPAEWDAFDADAVWLKEWESAGGADKEEADDEISISPSPQDFNPRICREIEGEYWRGLNFGKPPMYGADLRGTLFTPQTKHWNVNSLDNILTRLKLKRKIAGVTEPYLYFGMWRATFAWHVEDMDLYSINYIHFGAPKQWYAIPQKDRLRFETALASAFSGDARRCSQFMRHKSYLASPTFLAANNIRPLKLVQHAGEFVITYPFGYHSGFNLGFNCAESVNFALESWLDIGRKAKACECQDAQQSVTMDVDAMLEEDQEMREAERRREERDKLRAERGVLDEEKEARKREEARIKRAERKKAKEEEIRLGLVSGEDAEVGSLPPKKRPRMSESVAPSPATSKNGTIELPCVFCPSTSTEEVVSIPADAELSPETADQALTAHKFCANCVPECWIGLIDESLGEPEGNEEVKGYHTIPKARWSLKCSFCPPGQLAKYGCAVQCTYKNCATAIHPTCATGQDSGWFVDMVSGKDADRVEGHNQTAAGGKGKGKGKGGKKAAATTVCAEEEQEEDEEDDRLVLLCRNHNPETRHQKFLSHLCSLRSSILLNDLHLPGSITKVKAAGGGTWEVAIVALRDGFCPEGLQDSQDGEGGLLSSMKEDHWREGEVLVVDRYTPGVRRQVKWGKILFEKKTSTSLSTDSVAVAKKVSEACVADEEQWDRLSEGIGRLCPGEI